MRSRMAVVLSVLAVLLLGLGALHVWRQSRRLYCWTVPGSIQGLGNSSELWLFLEYARMVGCSRDNNGINSRAIVPVGNAGSISEVVVMTATGGGGEIPPSCGL